MKTNNSTDAVLLTPLNRTIIESLFFTCKRFDESLYHQRTARFMSTSDTTTAFHKRLALSLLTHPWTVLCEEVASWTYTKSTFSHMTLSSSTESLMEWTGCLFHKDRHPFLLFPLRSMHYFIKVLADSHDHRIQLLLEHPLWLAVLITWALRIRRYPHPSPEWLEQGEFKFSRNEYKMYGLDQKQSWQLTRAIDNLIRHGFIAKSDKKAGRKQINVYRFMNYDIIAPYLADQTSNSQQSNTNQTGNRHPPVRVQTENGHSRKSKKENKRLDREWEYPSSSLNSIGGGVEGEDDSFKATMIKVESEGTQFIQAWNTLTNRQDRMDDKVKKSLYNIINAIHLADFTQRVEAYRKLLSIIQEHRLWGYMYYHLEHFDLWTFLQHINKFYGTLDQIAGQLAVESERKRMMSKIRTILSPPSKPPDAPPPAPVDKEKLEQLKATMRQKFSR